jgi:hypothetical protein
MAARQTLDALTELSLIVYRLQKLLEECEATGELQGERKLLHIMQGGQQQTVICHIDGLYFQMETVAGNVTGMGMNTGVISE